METFQYKLVTVLVMFELPKMLEKKKFSLVLAIHCKGPKLLRTKKERKRCSLDISNYEHEQSQLLRL